MRDSSPRWGAHFGPHTCSISRSCSSSSAWASARPGMSSLICTANDSKLDHDENSSSIGASMDSAKLITATPRS